MTRQDHGFTLLEMMVTLVILSILAGLTVPYAELIVTRQKEYELREALRDIRSAIDRFHDDWEQGRLQNDPEVVSKNGYPVELMVLVKGAKSSGQVASITKYLRTIPKDPFATSPGEEPPQWRYIGYEDAYDASDWGGVDVYDVRSLSDKQAIDKSYYSQW